MINMLTQSSESPRLKKAKGFVLASLIAGAMALPFVLPAPKARAENGFSEQGGDSEPCWDLAHRDDTRSGLRPARHDASLHRGSNLWAAAYVQGETGNGPGEWVEA